MPCAVGHITVFVAVAIIGGLFTSMEQTNYEMLAYFCHSAFVSVRRTYKNTDGLL